MQTGLMIFVGSSVVPLTFAAVAIALFAFWFFLNRERDVQPSTDEDLVSLSTTLHESSTEFDLPDFPDFLQRVAPHFQQGFGEREISRLASAAKQLPHEREAKFEFQVVFQNVLTPLQIRLFKDDASSIGVYFFTSKPLMELFDREMEGFFAERNM